MGWLDEVLIRPTDFSWQPGVTPMSDFVHLLCAEVASASPRASTVATCCAT
jgi:hypothetical protein